MNVVRWVLAAAFAALGCWCLLWLAVLVVLGFFASSGPSFTDYLIVAGFVLASFAAAYLIVPWRPNAWRQRREGV